MKWNRKKLAGGALALVLVAAAVIGLVTVPSITAEAYDVIYEDDNPGFSVANYAGKPLDQDYKPQGEILYDGGTEYKEDVQEYSLRTNSFVWWEEEDNLTFAYNDYTLSYGDQSRLTLQGTFDRQAVETEGHDMHINASVGLAIRGGNDKASNGVYLHMRDSVIMVVYREKDGAATKRTAEEYTITGYPVQFKLVKSGNLFTPSFKCGDDNWVQMKPIAVVMSNETVYAGVAAHSTDPETFIRCDFRDYSAIVEGPDGSIYEPGGSGEGGEEGGEPADEPAVRPDPEVTEGVLFRETFTDGSLVNTDPDDEVANPVWTNDYAIDGSVENATIELDENGNNYWRRNFSIGTYFFPNKDWYDYSASYDVKFGPNNDDVTKEASVDFYVRFRANRQSGFYGYLVSLERVGGIEKANIYKIASKGNPHEGEQVASVNFNYVSEDWHTYKIEAFDNTITLYQDDVQVLSYEDNGDRSTAAIGRGGIGIGTTDCDVMIDNIVVRQMEDLYGGDWDNKIGGNWDDPVPDYILNYESAIE